MMRRTLAGIGVVLAGLVALGLVWFLGMRRKDSFVVTAQRRVNRALVNPQQMRTAGTPGAHAAVLRHVGRRSGRRYETPVTAVPTDDGFVVALVYGQGTDWLRNVLAAGSATLVHEGRTHQVDHPEVVPFSTQASRFRDDEQLLRLFHVEHCVRLHRVASGA
jgi:deazaflavin-dependent oxidoreductase (nitroreductase family)